MTGNSGNISTEELGRRRFFALQQAIQNRAVEIVEQKSGKFPCELTVYGAGGSILEAASTTVTDHNGDFTWARGKNLENELSHPNWQVISMKFESNDDGRVFEFADINLDEMKDATGSGAPPAETRKTQVAGATD